MNTDQDQQRIREYLLAHSAYEARPANGSSAIFRACLIAVDKRR